MQFPGNKCFKWEPLTFSYDAAGRQAGSTQTISIPGPQEPPVFYKHKTEKGNIFDGNGRLVKQSISRAVGIGSPTVETTFYLRSSLTGNTIVELSGTGGKKKAYVYAGTTVLAEYIPAVESYVAWNHINPVMGDSVSVGSNSVALERMTADPTGVNTGDTDPFPGDANGEFPDQSQLLGGSIMAAFFPGAGAGGCTAVVDNFAMGCGTANILMELGAAEQCPDNDCGPQWARIRYHDGTERDVRTRGFRSYNNGRSGYGMYDSDLLIAAGRTERQSSNNDVTIVDLDGNDGPTIGDDQEWIIDVGWGSSFSYGLSDVCKFLLPTHIPSGESVDRNMQAARERVAALRSEAGRNAEEIRRSGDLGANAAAGSAALAADLPGGSIDRWFESMVAEGNPWDYKQRGDIYEDFGNFNYGATGAAMGYSLDSLQRVAGWVQKVLREGESPTTKLQARLGYGGTYPYGDQKKDAVQISMGVSYYHCRKKNPL